MDRAFVDTNVLVYLYSDDKDKRKRAYLTLRSYECYISVQVAMEFCSVCTKKLKLSTDKVRQALTEISMICSMRPVTPATIGRALDVQARYGFSFYDSVMIASALEHGCRYLLSEDMKHRQVIEGAMIFNVFVG